MKKRLLIGFLILLVISCTTFCVGKPIYEKWTDKKKDQEKLEEIEKEKERIKNAKVIVTLEEELNAPFYTKPKVSDYIKDINGEIVDDYTIDTTQVGEKEIFFEYINEEGIKIPYSYKLNIKDVVSPSIWLGSSYTIYKGYEGNIVDDIVCADDYDDNPTCLIKGTYDPNVVGDYLLVFEATDFSGNKTSKEFTLHVINPPTTGGTSTDKKPVVRTEFADVIKNYKTDFTKIGIDVSGWQGEIDFEAVRDAGVEFVFIKVGGTKGIDADYYVDSKFIRNIEGFNEVGIPVGIYFYSYAASSEAAKKDAEWLLEQIKGYKVDLPIVYDWENWSFFNEFHLSFYSLTKNAKTFLDAISEAGYKGALYSSKNYLEKAWLPLDYETWLAHYTDKTSYEGDYTYWQLCDNGRINGINGNVDIDIMYSKKEDKETE